MKETEMQTCPQCGAALPANAPAGICPTCLMQAGLASEPHPGSLPEVARTTPLSGFVPPQPADLAKHFPQLEILTLLGRGGMGAVYKARQPGLDRFVAVKILPPEVGTHPTFAERFTREARALARLSHQNIVSVFDFGQADGQFYFIMEFVDGANLRQLIEAGELSPQGALAIVPQICEALQFAHDEGVVHRDIKPENILIDKRGRVKIADFGLAKLLGQHASDASLTVTHQVMGTVRYMAPEQMEGSSGVDHRADIYSLGVVFYELLTGELPMGKFAPPSEKVQIDVRLDEVVLRTLEQKPELRYQQASEVKTDVETISRSAHAHSPRGEFPGADRGADRSQGGKSGQSAGLPLPPASQIRGQVRGPGMGLMLYGLLLLFPALLCFTNGWDFSDGNDGIPVGAGFAMIGLSFVLLGWAGLVIRGGWHLLALENYGAALLASFLGLPVGLWGLMVLSRPAVKASFAVGRQSPGGPPGRPRLVPVLAILNLVGAVLLMLVCTMEQPALVAATSPTWWMWEQVDSLLGFTMAAGMFAASIGLFLWKPWARKLTLAVCVFGLASVVFDAPYLSRVLIPDLYAQFRLDLAAEGMEPAALDFAAMVSVAAFFGGVLLAGVVCLVGQLMYFTRPAVVAAFVSPDKRPSRFFEWLFTGAGAVAGVIAVFGPLALLLGVSALLDRSTTSPGTMTTQEVPSLGTITSGIGAEFIVPAGQVAMLEVVTRRDNETVAVPPHCGYIMAPPDAPLAGTFRWKRVEEEEGGAAARKWSLEIRTADGGGSYTEAALLPDELESSVGVMSLGLGMLVPNEELIHWGSADVNDLPADGLIGLRVTVLPHGMNWSGSGSAHIDWTKSRPIESTSRRKLPAAP